MSDVVTIAQVNREGGGESLKLKVEDPATRSIRRFVWILAFLVALLSVTPYVYALIHTPPGTRYLGFEYNTDDHMVYAAWMRQAMEGRFFFDNRFAIERQPSLTIHVYFWLLGILAKLTGIGAAAAIARALFAFIFVHLLARFIRLVTPSERVLKLGLVFCCFGAGIGFLAWQTLGQDFYRDSANPLKGILLGHLPNDVWQPEAYVFPSLLTNSLFSVSLCLILAILICVLQARDSWKPVIPGAIGFLLLMNIHSYDVLLLAFVLLGLLVASIVAKRLTWSWLVRVVVIGLGAVPSALWFLYVLRSDPVFQSRAATLTYTENFRSILAGSILVLVFAAIGAAVWLTTRPRELRVKAGLLLFLILVAGMSFGASSQSQGYWLGYAAWALLYLAMLTTTGLLARGNDATNLVLSWASIGLVAPYFPGLFQRKLMMGFSVPWAILAAVALVFAIQQVKANERRLLAIFSVVLLGATSICWFGRAFEMINANVSNTTLQPVYLSADEQKVIEYLNEHRTARDVLLAMPGIPSSVTSLEPPVFPDLAPILSGLTGVYTFAGHWSETPEYAHKRSLAASFFLRMPFGERFNFTRAAQIDYILAPVDLKVGNRGLEDVRDMGSVVVDTPTMRLIKVAR